MVDLDRKLVASEEQYEVAYLATKHGISAEKARAILDRASRSREKADEMAAPEKGR